jgi:flagellar biosynthesis anti-sigma factor FlgM
MKIDPRIQPDSDLQSDSVKGTKKSAVQTPAGKSGSSSSGVSGDTFQASSTQAEVQKLTSQVASVPDVRTERVAPLKAAVGQKAYQPDSGKIADAMLSQAVGSDKA